MAALFDLFGPGRTSLKRGAVGMALAILVGFCIAPLPLFLIVVGSDWGGGSLAGSQVRSALSLLAIAFVVVAVVTLVLGGLVWTGLRLTRTESGRAYAVLGGLAGFVVPVTRGGLGGGGGSQAATLAFCALAGVVVALTFWLVAREPRHKTPS